MRKLYVIMGIILLLLKTDTVSATLINEELMDISTMLTAYQYSIEDWTVTIKEKPSKEQLKQILYLLHHKDELKVSKDKNTRNYSVQNKDPQKGIIETYRMIIPKNKQHSPEFIVTIKGNYWNDDYTATYQARIMDVMKNYFTHNADTYTCVTAINDDIMEHVNFLEKLSKKLRNITIQDDTINSIHKNIMYGYTPKWDKNIKLLGQRLNVQVVSQEVEDGKQKIIIGTPILINEY